MENLIDIYLSELKLLCNFYNKEYRFTLIDKKFVNKLINENICNKITLNKYLFEKCKNYFDNITKKISILNNKEFFEQKSMKWHLARQNMITATDSGKLLSGSDSRFKEVLVKKIDKIKAQPVSSATPLVHGNTYEDVSLKIYESRFKVKVSEYSILGSDSHPYIGASPDGVITSVDYTDYNSFCRYGRLLEIKNPYSRVIDGVIKSDYYAQMQQQMFVTGLPICDFLETEIKDIRCINSSNCYDEQYQNIYEMLNDKLDTTIDGWQNKIENKNIPVNNLNKMGLEKGVIIVFKKEFPLEIEVEDNKKETIYETLNKYEIFPLSIEYNYDTIMKWIQDKKDEYHKQNYTCEEVLYWKLYKFSVITVNYEQEKFENITLPILKNGWKKIDTFKTQNSDAEIKKFLFEYEFKKKKKKVNSYVIDM